MRNSFFTTDGPIPQIMEDLSAMLKGWGLRGNCNDVIRYALYYAAEGHGLRKRGPGRDFKKSLNAKGADIVKHDDRADRRGPSDDAAP